MEAKSLMAQRSWERKEEKETERQRTCGKKKRKIYLYYCHSYANFPFNWFQRQFFILFLFFLIVKIIPMDGVSHKNLKKKEKKKKKMQFALNSLVVLCGLMGWVELDLSFSQCWVGFLLVVFSTHLIQPNALYISLIYQPCSNYLVGFILVFYKLILINL